MITAKIQNNVFFFLKKIIQKLVDEDYEDISKADLKEISQTLKTKPVEVETLFMTGNFFFFFGF